MKWKFRPRFWIGFAIFLGVAIAVGAILPKFLPRPDHWRHCEMFLGQMEMALAMYRQDYDEYPPGGPTGLSRLGKPGKRGAYYEFRESQLDPELRVLDPWRHPYVYRVHRREGKADRVELYSVGPNGIDEAGKGDDVTP